MLNSTIYFTETGSIYTSALDTANGQMQSGQSILDSYRLQELAPVVDPPANGNQRASNKGSKPGKKRTSARKKTAGTDSGKSDNAYVRSLDIAELNEQTAPTSDLMDTDEGVFIHLIIQFQKTHVCIHLKS
jgi:hypothetical protein